MSHSHINLTAPCGEGEWNPQRLCRDLGLEPGTRLVSVCGCQCSNPQHATNGTRVEAQSLRLTHLLTSEATRDLSDRDLATLAGCSHATVGRHRRQTQKVLGVPPKEFESGQGAQATENLLSDYLKQLAEGKVGNKYRIQVLNTVVTDPAYQGWSNQRLATLLAVTPPTIAAARARVGVDPTQRICSDGRLMKKPRLPRTVR